MARHHRFRKARPQGAFGQEGKKSKPVPVEKEPQKQGSVVLTTAERNILSRRLSRGDIEYFEEKFFLGDQQEIEAFIRTIGQDLRKTRLGRGVRNVLTGLRIKLLKSLPPENVLTNRELRTIFNLAVKRENERWGPKAKQHLASRGLYEVISYISKETIRDYARIIGQELKYNKKLKPETKRVCKTIIRKLESK